METGQRISELMIEKPEKEPMKGKWKRGGALPHQGTR